MSRWYLDENDRDIYWKDDKGLRWNYNTKELVRILNDLETKLRDVEQEQIQEMQEHQEAMELADKTIKNLVEDNRASQEWYKKQLAESESRFQAHKQNDARIIQDQTDLIENLRQQLDDTEEQNKRVLEKLELIVSANQELEQKLAEKEIESLKVDGVLNEELEEKDYTIIKPFLKETLTIEEIKHIIKNLSDFNLRQTSFHDIQKNDVIFNAYINKHIAYKKCLDLLDLVDQDKISFCIEQFEQVKNEITPIFCVPNGIYSNLHNEVFKTIDNKIKAIKEMK